ncbi:hypothetical protein ACH5RR_037311 [Cinchona calisaya]|uniref:Uncharacterized protein n=1 Tax=Cinchona calisaya TaxID=153742 RepID=A0ABD2YAI0_9GENT
MMGEDLPITMSILGTEGTKPGKKVGGKFLPPHHFGAIRLRRTPGCTGTEVQASDSWQLISFLRYSFFSRTQASKNTILAGNKYPIAKPILLEKGLDG